jgi:hypothetical protein
MNDTRCGLAALLVALAALALCSAAPEKKPAKSRKAGGADEASIWMTRKLECSQNVLAGLTAGDFEKVKKNADAMLVVTYLEKWDRADLPQYKRQLRSFEDANKDLIRGAGDRDVKTATRAYTRLIVSCVECHSVVRDAKKGK